MSGLFPRTGIGKKKNLCKGADIKYYRFCSSLSLHSNDPPRYSSQKVAIDNA